MSHIPFRTTAEQIKLLATITTAMVDWGLNEDFIASAARLAYHDQGVFDLMKLWFDHFNLAELKNTKFVV